MALSHYIHEKPHVTYGVDTLSHVHGFNDSRVPSFNYIKTMKTLESGNCPPWNWAFMIDTITSVPPKGSLGNKLTRIENHWAPRPLQGLAGHAGDD